MKVVPLSKTEKSLQADTCCWQNKSADCVGMAAGGALLVGGVLLLTGHRRAGTVAATSGTVLALVDQQELVKSWWNQLPGYLDQLEQMIDHAQETLGRAQEMVDHVAAKREKMRTLLNR